jgi:ABC-type nickel/cobalt efflux system permease component RcnA
MTSPGEKGINSLYRIVHEYGPDSRLLLALLMLIASLYFSFNLMQFAVLLIPPALWLIWDVLRHSSVWRAFHAFRANDLATVRLSLSQVRWPNLLEPETIAYYHWLKGVVDVADARFAAAKVHLLVAASGSLRTENDRSLVHCLLAEVALQEKKEEEAKEHLHHARALQHHPNVERMITALTDRLSR